VAVVARGMKFASAGVRSCRFRIVSERPTPPGRDRVFVVERGNAATSRRLLLPFPDGSYSSISDRERTWLSACDHAPNDAADRATFRRSRPSRNGGFVVCSISAFRAAQLKATIREAVDEGRR